MKYAFMLIELACMITGAISAVYGDIEGATLLWAVAIYMTIQRNNA
jgi:hypothetical protein